MQAKNSNYRNKMQKSTSSKETFTHFVSIPLISSYFKQKIKPTLR